MRTAAAVRPAETADIDRIVALEAEAFPLDPWSPRLVAEGVEGTLPTVAVLAAEVADRFAGYAVVSVVAPDAELQRIAVVPELRRSGVAGALLGAVVAHCVALLVDRLILEVREDNEAAIAFYARHDFTELGRRARYYRDGTTALVLSAPVTMAP
ncbi:MAG TPA: ribosomal protein S18-alanine N-acetyltransferase [Nocardioides sp.]|nr:ribosomal protein S18-alanine N-acetyltransferase [Nocardioides sp.]